MKNFPKNGFKNENKKYYKKYDVCFLLDISVYTVTLTTEIHL
jgi:hypothetical protein